MNGQDRYQSPRLRTIEELRAWKAPAPFSVLDERVSYGFQYGGFIVVDDRRCIIDRFRSRSVAEYAARQLNSELASIDSHAVVGCKVVAA